MICLTAGAYINDLDIRFWDVVRLLVAGLSGFLLLVGALAWLISRRITRPLALLRDSMKRLSEGDLETDVPGTGRRDEVGAMAAAVLVFKENALRTRMLEREQREANAHRAAQDEQVRQESDAAAAATSLVVNSIGKGLEALSIGDLTMRLETALPPAYEKLRIDFNAVAEQIEGLIRNIIAITASIDSGSTHIVQAANDLSKQTEGQAASLEQSAAALAQLTATVCRTVENAMNVSQVVLQTGTDAEQSGEIVRKAIGAMDNIERSSNGIIEIIGVIDEIASQTNLLALNAGGEAERAGECGRGFAVVASEARALAERSADAAKQIKTLIATAAADVEIGVKLVNEASGSLDRIVAQVAEMTVIVAEMAASAQEQAMGLFEVNAAVNHIDETTQQNAAKVEESTAASRALGQETFELVQLTSRFQVQGLDAASSGIGRRFTDRTSLKSVA